MTSANFLCQPTDPYVAAASAVALSDAERTVQAYAASHNRLSKQVFTEELEDFSYFIPPNFPMQLAIAKVGGVTRRFYFPSFLTRKLYFPFFWTIIFGSKEFFHRRQQVQRGCNTIDAM